MVKDSEKHAFTVVIVWKLDRFARNRYDSATYRNILKKNGVKVISAMENISDSPEGIILEGLMESLAEYYSANLSENIKRGLYDSALERKVLSTTLFGYQKTSDGKYEPHPVTAPVVKQIFSDFANGKPYMQIVDELNSAGYVTGRNMPFSKNSLRYILRNEKYIGVYRYKDIIDPHGIPPIIDKALFNRVQKELKRRSFTKVKKKDDTQENFMLTGKLYCGHCGEMMTGESARSKGGTYYHYYSCSGMKAPKKNGCRKKRVSKEKIEDEVIRIINTEILTDDFIDDMVPRVMKYQESDQAFATIRNLEEMKKQEQRKLDNIMKAIESGIWSDSVNSRLNELEHNMMLLEQRIQEEKLSMVQFTADDIKAFLYALKNAQKTDSDAQQYLINACINRIYLFDEDDGQKLVIHVNMSDHETEPITLQSVVRSMSDSLHLNVHTRTLTDGVVLLSTMFRP
jgi:DNA invertase Pin-like site-specific DNA recombinase